MNAGLSGSSVVIVGAGGGQGRAGAVAFAREGSQLFLGDIDGVGLEETVQEVYDACPDASVWSRPIDMSSVDSIESFGAAVLAKSATIDVVYNNAGVNHVGAISDIDEGEFDRVHDINLKGAFFLVKACLPGLRRSGNGSVINVSSGAGWLAPADGQTLYCSSKGGLNALTKAQARDLADDGIRANCLLPGPIETPMVRRFFESMPDGEQEATKARVLERSLFRRFGQPEEVASVAVFLASPEASYITGALIAVDAGWTAV